MQIKKELRKGLAVVVVLLFIGVAIVPTICATSKTRLQSLLTAVEDTIRIIGQKHKPDTSIEKSIVKLPFLKQLLLRIGAIIYLLVALAVFVYGAQWAWEDGYFIMPLPFIAFCSLLWPITLPLALSLIILIILIISVYPEPSLLFHNFHRQLHSSFQNTEELKELSIKEIGIS